MEKEKVTSKEIRKLADKFWERGLKDISSQLHDVARVLESQEKYPFLRQE